MPENYPFGDERRMTRTERRAAAERRRLREQAMARAERDGSLLDWDPSQNNQVTVPQQSSAPQRPTVPGASDGAPWAGMGSGRGQGTEEEEVERRSNATPNFLVGLLVLVLSLMVGVGMGAPLLGHGIDWRYALGGALGVLLGGWWAWKKLPEVSTKVVAIAALLSLLLSGAFVTGAFTSVVIDGKVYASNSKTAEAYRISNDMYADLQYLASVDPMLDAEQAQARNQYAQYAPTAEKLADISKRWAAVAADPGALPAPLFATAAGHTANAADWASKAMIRKGEIIVQPDARGETDVASYRATYIEQVQSAGPVLKEVTGYYGIDLEGSGPQE